MVQCKPREKLSSIVTTFHFYSIENCGFSLINHGMMMVDPQQSPTQTELNTHVWNTWTSGNKTPVSPEIHVSCSLITLNQKAVYRIAVCNPVGLTRVLALDWWDQKIFIYFLDDSQETWACPVSKVTLNRRNLTLSYKRKHDALSCRHEATDSQAACCCTGALRFWGHSQGCQDFQHDHICSLTITCQHYGRGGHVPSDSTPGCRMGEVFHLFNHLFCYLQLSTI